MSGHQLSAGASVWRPAVGGFIVHTRDGKGRLIMYTTEAGLFLGYLAYMLCSCVCCGLHYTWLHILEGREEKV